MATKKRIPVTVRPSEFRLYFYLKMQGMQFSVAQFAKHLGVSRQAVDQLLSGDMKPSDAMLAKVGLEVVYQVTEAERDALESRKKKKV